ncbi:MAG TPA: DUF998 domain-containing protein [Candidatus Binatia bacterium]|nr:DUF998 domain-containing protein [Candidatus Binatia bacterium]
MRPKLVYRKIGAYAGIAAPIVGFIFILSAIESYPQFSWTNNALSDLGVVSGLTAPLFNFGLIASGFLAFIFAVVGLFNYFDRSLVGRAGVEAFEAATLALIGIGIFNENFQDTHYILSVAFFLLAPVSLFVLTCAFWISHRRGMSVFTLLVGVATALPWLLQFTFNYVPNVAIPEFISGLVVSVWTVVLGEKRLKP